MLRMAVLYGASRLKRNPIFIKVNVHNIYSRNGAQRPTKFLEHETQIPQFLIPNS